MQSYQNSPDYKDINDSEPQYAQKCTICGNWLWAGEDICTNPVNNHMVHEACILRNETSVSRRKSRKNNYIEPEMPRHSKK